MNQVSKLQQIAEKSSRRIIGLMSGTSLDGLDIALCRLTGSATETQLEVEAFNTLPYDQALVNEIKTVFAQSTVNLEQLCHLNASIGRLHGQMVIQQLSEWQIAPTAVDLIASHGQTVFHAPRRTSDSLNFDSTLQIGDGDHIAHETGIITVCDFRQRHIAAGGEGAPLVAYGDSLLFRAEESRLLLNIGGIANFTFLPAMTMESYVICSDTGPGNTLMDQFIQQQRSQRFDINGQLAASGTSNSDLLDALLDHNYFSAPFPKTTGPELFNLQYLDQALTRSQTNTLSDQDVLATLCDFTIQTIVMAIKQLNKTANIDAIYVSGGGLQNTYLMETLQAHCEEINMQSTASLGINPDAKEAVLFALLANECVAGDASTTQAIHAMPSTSMGKICFPS